MTERGMACDSSCERCSPDSPKEITKDDLEAMPEELHIAKMQLASVGQELIQANQAVDSLAGLAKASVISRGRCFESDADVALRRWLEKEGYIGPEPLPPTRGPASATLVEP